MSNKENNLGGLIKAVMDGKEDKVTLCKEIYAEVFSLCYPVIKDREESKTVAKRALIEVCSNIDSINLNHNVSRQIATIVSVFLFDKINGKEELADRRERKEYSYNQIQEDRKLFNVIKDNAGIFKSARAYKEYEGDLKNLTALQMVLIELYAYEMHSIDDIEDMLDIDSSFICSEISDVREILCGVEFEQEWTGSNGNESEDEEPEVEESLDVDYSEDSDEEEDILNDKASGVDRLEKIEKDYEPEKTISKSGIAQYWDNLSYSMKKLIVTITSVVIVLVVIVVLMASVSANQKKKVSSNGSTAAATKNTQKTESSTTKTTQSTLKSTENTTIADTASETESETQTIKAANDNNNTNITAANRNNRETEPASGSQPEQQSTTESVSEPQSEEESTTEPESEKPSEEESTKEPESEKPSEEESTKEPESEKSSEEESTKDTTTDDDAKTSEN